jgi:paraquat-inducible protein A
MITAGSVAFDLQKTSMPLSYISCDQCGSRVPDRELQPGQSLRCGLCKSVLKRKRKTESFQSACAFGLAGMVFFVLANLYPIMNFSVAGNTQANEIVTGVGVLRGQGYGMIAGLVFFCAMAAPAVYFTGVTYVSLACLTRESLPWALPFLKLVRRAEPWSLVPVFAAACMVSAVKLDMIGVVEWQPGIGWIALLAVCALALGSLFDPAEAERRLAGKAKLA